MKKKLRKVLMPRMRRPRLFLDRRKRERAGKAMDYEAAIENIPRITNETVAEHREEVLSTARKYIYPLQHSKHRIVIISSILFGLVTIVFFTYVLLALYKFQSTSTFIYRVTQVVPLPVAKTSKGFVSYENYLFELRHFLHYYETQQRVDFSTTSGKEQLEVFRRRALDQVINRAYVKSIAAQHRVTVASAEVDRTINLLKDQNRLGSTDRVFQDVLRQYWGWSVDDFRRELKMELLEQKVSALLDTRASQKAQAAHDRAKRGEDFAALVKEYSEDEFSKQQNGDYGLVIKKNNRDISPQVIDALFSLKPGEVSGIVNTGVSLEINKVISSQDGQVKASHIVIALEPLSKHTEALKKKDNPAHYIKI